MVLFTPEHLESFKSQIPVGNDTVADTSSVTTVSPKALDNNAQNFDDYYFQVLVFDDLEKINNKQLDQSAKLLYGTRKQLTNYLRLSESNQSFPSSGVEVDRDFIDHIVKGKAHHKHSNVKGSVRFLLQTRKLSQLLAYTWIDWENENNETEISLKDKIEIPIIRKILKRYNKEFDTYRVNDKGEIISPDPYPYEDIKKPEKTAEKDFFLIKPESVCYESISLALLLCGQVYYKNPNYNPSDEKSDKFILLSDSIIGHFQMVYEFQFTISWDRFIGEGTELFHSGLEHTVLSKMTIGYPPRPSEFNLKQTQIRDWACAKDYEGQFPFYPMEKGENNKKFYSKKVQRVTPPSTYLPLSSV
ncbi:MAG: hypothetical protein AAGF83_03605 [Cyanobacteria bacterium P01_G01_bin.67]